jgi:hypothetical protein
MYFFYVDESGTLDTNIGMTSSNHPREWLYVLTAVSLFEKNWRGFEDTLNGKKKELAFRIRSITGKNLNLDECEVKSTWLRIPKERQQRPFLANLSKEELLELTELYYRQLQHNRMTIFSVIIDKRHLHTFMDPEKLHRKAWELLLERIQGFLGQDHEKHFGMMISDDNGSQLNRKLALKHAYILSEGTTSGLKLSHIVEMPLFVQSGLSNGVQLADLVGYNIYRAFRENDLDYPYFLRILPYIWSSRRSPGNKLDGLKVFPTQSSLVCLAEEAGNKIARNQAAPSSEF